MNRHGVELSAREAVLPLLVIYCSTCDSRVTGDPLSRLTAQQAMAVVASKKCLVTRVPCAPRACRLLLAPAARTAQGMPPQNTASVRVDGGHGCRMQIA